MLSDTFKARLLQSRLRTPQYRTAIKYGFHPTALSAMVHGAVMASRDDARIVRLGAALGLAADECFADDQQQPIGQ